VEVVLAQADEIDRINRDVARSKDEFLAMLAHELRNPLAPIRNAVEILRRGADADTVALLVGHHQPPGAAPGATGR
jgi:signal transduction histidine kinase